MAKEPFVWGISGHPYVQAGYPRETVDKQLDLVRASGGRWYRCDWHQGALRRDPAPWDRLLAEASRRGLRLLPILLPDVPQEGSTSPEPIRKAAAQYAREMAARYRGRVMHWELHNELDIGAMVRKGEPMRNGETWQWDGAPDGDRPEHYHEERYRRSLALLRGLAEGVKAADPKAVTLINSGGWLHTGFIDRIAGEDRVPFDVIGWHWYSEMGDMTKVRGTINVLDRLRAHGKPIWITEANRRGGSQGGKEADQAAYLRELARQMRRQADVEAFFAYELFDEPYFGADNPESHYGLVTLKRDASGAWAPGKEKPAFQALREVITRPER